jgi:hypothetical protein
MRLVISLQVPCRHQSSAYARFLSDVYEPQLPSF